MFYDRTEHQQHTDLCLSYKHILRVVLNCSILDHCKLVDFMFVNFKSLLLDIVYFNFTIYFRTHKLVVKIHTLNNYL